MSANILDKITASENGGNPVPTTVSSARSIGGTTLSCVALTHWPTATAVHLITYKKKADGSMDRSTLCLWKGIVSGTTIGTLTLKGGTDAGNAVGDFVEMAPTSTWAQGIYDWGTVSHNVDGTMITSLPLTTPKITTSINDSNGNEVIKTPATSSAVNEFTATNAATGNAPELSATGGDTNINLKFTPKGTGKIDLAGPTTNKYCFRAYATGSTTIADNTATKILLAGEDYDYNSNFASSTYTAPVAGVYHFDGAFQFSGAVASPVIGQAGVFVNGSEKFSGAIGVPESTGGYSVSGDCLLAAGDTVELYGTQDSAGAEPIVGATNRTYFSGHLVHAV